MQENIKELDLTMLQSIELATNGYITENDGALWFKKSKHQYHSEAIKNALPGERIYKNRSMNFILIPRTYGN